MTLNEAMVICQRIQARLLQQARVDEAESKKPRIRETTRKSREFLAKANRMEADALLVLMLAAAGGE